MAFDEVQFDPLISFGALGGPEFNTDIIKVDSGGEFRNVNWADPLRRWTVGHEIKEASEFTALLNFFMARDGMARGFRFKDWFDYTATQEDFGTLTGGPTYQLIKTYSSGGQDRVRNIVKPVASPAMTMRRNGGAFAAFAVATTTGIITLTADSTAVITGITQANPGVVTTSASHGFSNGDYIYLAEIVGMTELNGTIQVIANVTATTFEVEDTSAMTAYASAGVASKHVQPGETLDWSGEFDVPARFNSDAMRAQLTNAGLKGWAGIEVAETRDFT
jgi:uncharacterized protein (TIGR02217 family)